MAKRSTFPAFFAGFEAFHALTHAYFALSRTKVRGHPAEVLGIPITPRFHAVAALLNAVVAAGLSVRAWKSERLLEPRREATRSFQPSARFATAEP